MELAPIPEQDGAPKHIPVTMLSGFLGAGKTTLLRHLLENSKMRIGCIVNDVASVNIDAKLIQNDRRRGKGNPEASKTTADLADTIELANGCACCSLQDELFASFEQLLALSDRKGSTYDRFVLENSGVAEPQNIRDRFNEAVAAGHPLAQRIALDSLVTVVDAGTFIADYSSRTSLAGRPDLGEGGSLRPVVDLLVEQIECADYVVLNKVDQLKEQDDVGSLTAILASLNPLARVVSCEQGKVPIEEVFGRQAQALVARLNIEGQHRGAVSAAAAPSADGCSKCAEEGHHDHHDHHQHGLDHDHKHDHDHGHDHGRDHGHDGHEHGHGGHKHEHGGEHVAHKPAHAPRERQETTAAARFGIRSFVYSRRRPFHPQRLRDMVLRWLPVATNSALEGAAPEAGDSPIKTVLRSKGFMWMSNSHVTAFFWSHAGQHFEIRDEGDWWAAVPDEDWPEAAAQRATLLADWDLATQSGDRRQEIVFIGAGMDEEAISRQLDTALLSDEEFSKYQAHFAGQPDPPHADVAAARAALGNGTSSGA